MALRSTLPAALARLLGVLGQHGHGVLVGVYFFIDGLLAIEDGVPELVLAAHAVNADVAASHLPRILAPQGVGTVVVGLGALCLGGAASEQQQGGQYCLFHCLLVY